MDWSDGIVRPAHILLRGLQLEPASQNVDNGPEKK